MRNLDDFLFKYKLNKLTNNFRFTPTSNHYWNQRFFPPQINIKIVLRSIYDFFTEIVENTLFAYENMTIIFFSLIQSKYVRE